MERTIPEPTLTPEPPAPPALLEPTVIAIQAPAEADESPLTLTVHAGAVDFGRVSADGTLDPAVPALSSTTDSRGAYYVLAGAIQVNVTSDVPWTGSCRVAENAGSTATIPIAAGRLEWRLAGTEGWTPFAPNVPDPACFPAPEVGSQMFVYDLRLRVEAGDPPGAVAAVLAFEATP